MNYNENNILFMNWFAFFFILQELEKNALMGALIRPRNIPSDLDVTLKIPLINEKQHPIPSADVRIILFYVFVQTFICNGHLHNNNNHHNHHLHYNPTTTTTTVTTIKPIIYITTSTTTPTPITTSTTTPTHTNPTNTPHPISSPPHHCSTTTTTTGSATFANSPTCTTTTTPS